MIGSTTDKGSDNEEMTGVWKLYLLSIAISFSTDCLPTDKEAANVFITMCNYGRLIAY